MDIIEIKIEPPFIKLEQFLKFAEIAVTGGHAKILIQNNEISVNGEICTMRGKKLYDGDIIDAGLENRYKCVISD